jgi:hypothetical protein
LRNVQEPHPDDLSGLLAHRSLFIWSMIARRNTTSI